MKRINETNRTTELFIKAGLTAAIAAALLLPVSINANGADAPGSTRAPCASERSHRVPQIEPPRSEPPAARLSARGWQKRRRHRLNGAQPLREHAGCVEFGKGVADGSVRVDAAADALAYLVVEVLCELVDDVGLTLRAQAQGREACAKQRGPVGRHVRP